MSFARYLKFVAALAIATITVSGRLFKPSTVFLGHHDGPGTMRWTSTFLAATAIRKALPKTRTMDVLYRTPVCFNTATKEMFVGQ